MGLDLVQFHTVRLRFCVILKQDVKARGLSDWYKIIAADCRPENYRFFWATSRCTVHINKQLLGVQEKD